jgi:hypothetical protein
MGRRLMPQAAILPEEAIQSYSWIRNDAPLFHSRQGQVAARLCANLS